MQNSPNKFLVADKPTVEILGHTRGGKVNAAKIVISPLERGFGYTLGHALRRILLSSMAGVAITDVRIKGVKHEYDTIEGMQEDVLSLLLNLKGIAFIIYDKKADRADISLKKEGPGVVTAGDINLPPNMEVVDPGYVIAHLNERGQLDMQMTIRQGTGYETAESRLARDILDAEESVSANSLHLDASYSPVLRVSYKVESARVKQQTDLDKLIIELETDGTLDPTAAIRRGTTLLYKQLKPMIDLESEEIISTQASQEDIPEIFFDKVEDKLKELGGRSTNCLRRANIEYLGDLVINSEADLMKQPSFGKRSLDEIKDGLVELDLELGMKLSGWPPKHLKREIKEEQEQPEEDAAS